ncbi:substrate-binding periplasmic protein [Kordiimonas marina]|uniref:substrate-binding periplasmic protein n=1 Tax=Kordiimonas marina TaxID=2872312 RepID=UPI001FF42737|nr:ABC transporter substrate-binding protein [Kordiimonas marina]
MRSKAKNTGAAKSFGALFAALGLLTLGLLPAQVQAASTPNKVSGPAPFLTLLTANNPPFAFKGKKDGTATGAAVDLVRSLMDKAEANYSMTLMPWNRAYELALLNANTCVFVTNRLKERETLFTWVGPLFKGGWALYRRAGSDINISSIKDLKGLAISGTFTPSQAAHVTNVYHAVPLQVADDLAAARLLYKGRADLWLSGLLRHSAIVKELGEEPVEQALVLARADLYMACNAKMDESLIAHLNHLNTNLGEAREASLARYDFLPAQRASQ